MKLYVVGESTPDPGTWSIWSEPSIVVASDIEEARQLGGSGEACEIPMDKAQVLMSMPEPAWGEDV